MICASPGGSNGETQEFRCCFVLAVNGEGRILLPPVNMTINSLAYMTSCVWCVWVCGCVCVCVRLQGGCVGSFCIVRLQWVWAFDLVHEVCVCVCLCVFVCVCVCVCVQGCPTPCSVW